MNKIRVKNNQKDRSQDLIFDSENTRKSVKERYKNIWFSTVASENVFIAILSSFFFSSFFMVLLYFLVGSIIGFESSLSLNEFLFLLILDIVLAMSLSVVSLTFR